MFFKKKDTSEEKPNYILKEYQSYLRLLPDNNLKFYIQNRVIDQIKYYDDSAIKKQANYKFWSIISITLSGLIPIFTLLTDTGWGLAFKLIVTTLSSAVTAITASVTLCAYKELWIQYRTNCEILKSVLHRFFLKSGEFKGKTDSELLETLVLSCEEYLTKEFQTWASATNKPESEN